MLCIILLLFQMKTSHMETSVFVPDFLLQLPTTFANELSPIVTVDPSLKQSLVYALFGDKITTTMSAQTLVSFGATDDKFYSHYDYSVWLVANKVSIALYLMFPILDS